MFRSRGSVRHFETFQKLIRLQVWYEKIKDLIISKCCKVIIYPKYDGFLKKKSHYYKEISTFLFINGLKLKCPNLPY